MVQPTACATSSKSRSPRALLSFAGSISLMRSCSMTETYSTDKLIVQEKSTHTLKPVCTIQPRMVKETIGQLIREGLAATGLNNSELARLVDVSPTYIGNLMRDISPSAKSGIPRPKPDIVDKIAYHLGIPTDRMRLAAGYAPEGTESTVRDIELERLAHYFRELPRECQLDVLALTEALWRRRRAESRLEGLKEGKGGKHTVKVERPGRKRPQRDKMTGT